MTTLEDLYATKDRLNRMIDSDMLIGREEKEALDLLEECCELIEEQEAAAIQASLQPWL